MLTNRVSATFRGTDLNPANNTAQTVNTAFAPLPTRMSGYLTNNNTAFKVTLTGQSGLRYQIQASTNFQGWAVLADGIATNGNLTVLDTDVPSNNARFYRGVRMLP